MRTFILAVTRLYSVSLLFIIRNVSRRAQKTLARCVFLSLSLDYRAHS